MVTRMSHTTYNYTRDRLGFDPGDREEKRLQHYAGVTSYQTNGASYSQSVRTQSVHHHSASNGNGSHYQEDILTGGVYEENLEKFRGSLQSLHQLPNNIQLDFSKQLEQKYLKMVK